MKNLFKNLFYTVSILFFSIDTVCAQYNGTWINSEKPNNQAVNIGNYDRSCFHIFNDNTTWENYDGLIFPLSSTFPSISADQNAMIMYHNKNDIENNGKRGFYFYHDGWYPILSSENYDTNLNTLSAEAKRVINDSVTVGTTNIKIYDIGFKNFLYSEPTVFNNSSTLSSTAPTGKYLVQVDLNLIIKSSEDSGPSIGQLIIYDNNVEVASSYVNFPNPNSNGKRRMNTSISKILVLGPNRSLSVKFRYDPAGNKNKLMVQNVTGSLTILNLN